MCGILGQVLRKPSIKSISMLATQSIGMDKRGGDSWGYWADGTIAKGLGLLHENVAGEDYAGFRRIIGHTRNATMGAKTKENAHPFTFGDITGVHNGIVYNHDELNTKYNRDFEVDSMHLFAHLAEGKDMHEIEGYGAIVYYDKGDDMIKMGRFNAGSLWIATIYDEKPTKKERPIGWAWCSTKECLASSMNVAGWGYWDAFEPKEDHTYWIDEKEAQIYYSDKRDLNVAYFVKPVVNNYKNSKNDYKGYQQSPKEGAQAGSTTTTSTGSNDRENAILLHRYAQGTYRQTCANCKEVERTIRHPEWNIELCFSCRTELDTTLEEMESTTLNEGFETVVALPSGEQITVVDVTQQHLMPV